MKNHGDSSSESPHWHVRITILCNGHCQWQLQAALGLGRSVVVLASLSGPGPNFERPSAGGSTASGRWHWPCMYILPKEESAAGLHSALTSKLTSLTRSLPVNLNLNLRVGPATIWGSQVVLSY